MERVFDTPDAIFAHYGHPVAADPLLGAKHQSGLWAKRTAVVSLYTDLPANGTTLCLDELGPVTPRLHASPPGWSPDGHRIKAPLEESRGSEKVCFSGALRVRDGHALTLTEPARNTAGYLQLLQAVERENPTGDLYLSADTLSSHKSPPIQAWLADTNLRSKRQTSNAASRSCNAAAPGRPQAA